MRQPSHASKRHASTNPNAPSRTRRTRGILRAHPSLTRSGLRLLRLVTRVVEAPYNAPVIKTKTIATLGPASSSETVVEQLIEAGIDVFRLNFSHGTLEDHAAAVKLIRKLADSHETALAIMGDLCGPKIRTGEIDEEHCLVNPGDMLIIERQPLIGNSRRISTTYAALVDEVQPDQRVLIDDGQIELLIESKTAEHVACRCIRGGILGTAKGVNLPDTELSTDALTAKDLIDVQWAIEQELDYLALSFVRDPRDLQRLRELLPADSCDMAIVSKIEKPQALEHLDAIIDASDAVLVARGDLGVEMPLTQVPLIQKDITRRCQSAGKPVIIATQMLQSMVDSSSPTRAEVSDVANAILDAADATMLSAETAIGEYPVESVLTMNSIAAEIEQYQQALAHDHDTHIEHRELRVASSLAHSARMLAQRLNPPLLAVWTQSGNSARILSKQRFSQPIVALTENPRTRNKLALNYGVIPILGPCPDNTLDMLNSLDRLLLDRGWVQREDLILVIAGTHFEHTGGNNALLIHRVGKP